jgi:hypothetical protein
VGLIFRADELLPNTPYVCPNFKPICSYLLSTTLIFMKRSKQILFSMVLLTAISSCSQNTQDQPIKGDENGVTRDTTIHQQSYRYYHGGWYPIIMMGSMMRWRRRRWWRRVSTPKTGGA